MDGGKTGDKTENQTYLTYWKMLVFQQRTDVLFCDWNVLPILEGLRPWARSGDWKLCSCVLEVLVFQQRKQLFRKSQFREQYKRTIIGRYWKNRARTGVLRHDLAVLEGTGRNGRGYQSQQNLEGRAVGASTCQNRNFTPGIEETPAQDASKGFKK